MKVKNYSKICFCGIGGSAVPGEIIKALNLKKPVLIARETLPASINSKTLCFVVSYSGNTKETIKLYKAAKKKKAKIIIITSGGKLSKVKYGEKILIPKGYLPRQALPFLIEPALKILKVNSKPIFTQLNNVSKVKARLIAGRLKKKIPVIYTSSEKLFIIAQRWESQFNENSKIFAHSDYFPAIAHNEIEARLGKQAKVILLLDKETKQIKKAKKFLKPTIIKLKGKTLLDKIMYGIYLGDLVSYYLAKYKGIKYKPVKRIDYLKK